MQLRRASRLALATLAVLFVSISSVRASTQQLTLAGGGCSGLTFTDLGQKFHYTAQLAISTGNETCIRVSKLYVKDACIADRDNELGLDTVKHVTCANVDDTETTTCNTVFSDGPSDALLNASVAIGQGDFDSGDVCANEADAYIFAQNTCNDTASSVTLSITVTGTDYDGSVCLDIAGHRINGIGIALVVVAVLIFIVLLSLVCYCCCCRR